MSKTFIKRLVWGAGLALAATVVALVFSFVTGRPMKHVTYRAPTFTSDVNLTGAPLSVHAELRAGGILVQAPRRAPMKIVVRGRWWVLCNAQALDKRVFGWSQDGGNYSRAFGELGKFLIAARPVPRMLQDDTVRLLGEGGDLDRPWLYTSGEEAGLYQLSGQVKEFDVDGTDFVRASAKSRDSLTLQVFATDGDSGEIYITIDKFSAQTDQGSELCPNMRNVTLASTGGNAEFFLESPDRRRPDDRRSGYSFRSHRDSLASASLRHLSVGEVGTAFLPDASGARLTIGVQEQELPSALPLLIRSPSHLGTFAYREDRGVEYAGSANSVIRAGEELVAARWKSVPEWLAAGILTALIGVVGYLLSTFIRLRHEPGRSGRSE